MKLKTIRLNAAHDGHMVLADNKNTRLCLEDDTEKLGVLLRYEGTREPELIPWPNIQRAIVELPEKTKSK